MEVHPTHWTFSTIEMKVKAVSYSARTELRKRLTVNSRSIGQQRGKASTGLTLY